MRVLIVVASALLLHAQPFASGPRTHAPSAGEAVDARLVFEDHEGLVWTSGPKGTFCYDGIRYLPATIFGLPAVEAKQLEITRDGTLWILIDDRIWWRHPAVKSGRFQLIENQRFEGMAAAGDQLYILEPGGVPGGILGVITRQKGSQRTSTLPGKSRIIQQDAHETWWLTSAETIVKQRQIKADSDGKAWYGTFSSLSWARWDGLRWLFGAVRVPPTDHLWQIVPVGHDDFLATDGHSVIRYYVKPGDTMASGFNLASESRVHSDHIFTSEHGTWVMINGSCVQLKDGVINYFRYGGNTPIYSLRAGKKVLWAAAGPAGLLSFSKERSVEWIQSYDSSVSIAKSAVRQGSRLLFGRADLTFEVLPDAMGWDFGLRVPTKVPKTQWFGLPAASSPYEDLISASDDSVWQVATKAGTVHLGPHGEFITTVAGHTAGRRVAQMRKLARSDDGRLWVGSTENLWEIIPGVLHSPPGMAPFQPTYRLGSDWAGPRYIADFTRDRQGRLHAVADHALLRYRDGRWAEQSWPGCLVDQRLRTAAIESEHSLWIGYRVADVFTHAWRAQSDAPWQCEHFSAANGFPGGVQFLRFDRQGQLWRGDAGGVWVARGRQRNRPSDWLHIGPQEGLLQADVTPVFAEEPEGSVLVGVGHMLQRIPPGLIRATPDSPPNVMALSRRGQMQAIADSVNFTQGEAAALLLGVPPADMPSALPPLEYRYGQNAWQAVSGYSLPLADAPAGRSILQLRFSGTALPRSLNVTMSPVLWRSVPVQAGFVGALLLAVWSLRSWMSLAVYRLRKWRYMRRQLPASASFTPLPPLPDWPHGTLLRGRYKVHGLLARGGFSDIFAASDEQSQKDVAIKRLRPLPMTKERSLAWLRRRFLQEVGIVSLLDHPGILPVLDTWFDEEGIPHITLPRVYGLNLREYLDMHAPLAKEQAIHFLRCVAETVASAHARGVIHCDLKPENIMIPQPGGSGFVRPVVVDFGTSALHLQSTILSEQTIPAGTVRYMAPEQLLGRYSTASDIYSFSIMALELIWQVRYDQLELAIDEAWEENLRFQLRSRALGDASIALLISALKWDPTQRPTAILTWTDALIASIETPRL